MRTAVMLWVLAWTASFASADPDDAARQHYERGQALYQAAHYREARAEFLAGYELAHKATFVFNAAECARLAGDLDTARDDYTRYLTLDPAGKQAALAQARLAALPVPAAVPPAAPPPPVIPPPAAVAAHVEQPIVVTGTAQVRHERDAPLWQNKLLWIGVGTALVAGTVAIYVTQHHEQATCTPPGCVVLP